MRWEEERYVRVYTRDTPDWIALPWEARAVFYELLRKVDRAGLVPMGRSGERGLAALLMMPFSVVEPGLAALLEDGCVVRSGTDLVVRRFIEAQEARQSDRARQRDSRERARAKAIGSATAVDSPPASEPTDAGSDTSDGAAKPPAEKTNDIAVGLSHGVTSGHQRSPAVTNCHSVPSRTVPSRDLTHTAREAEPTDPNAVAVLAALRSHKALADVATPQAAEWIAGRLMSSSRPLPLAVQAIADAARDAEAAELAGNPWGREHAAKMLARYVDNAKPPRDDAPRPGTRTYAAPEPVRTGTRLLTFDDPPRAPRQPPRPSPDATVPGDALALVAGIGLGGRS